MPQHPSFRRCSIAGRTPRIAAASRPLAVITAAITAMAPTAMPPAMVLMTGAIGVPLTTPAGRASTALRTKPAPIQAGKWGPAAADKAYARACFVSAPERSECSLQNGKPRGSNPGAFTRLASGLLPERATLVQATEQPDQHQNRNRDSKQPQ